jgi:hypothetical protein
MGTDSIPIVKLKTAAAQPAEGPYPGLPPQTPVPEGIWTVVRDHDDSVCGAARMLITVTVRVHCAMRGSTRPVTGGRGQCGYRTPSPTSF